MNLRYIKMFLFYFVGLFLSTALEASAPIEEDFEAQLAAAIIENQLYPVSVTDEVTAFQQATEASMTTLSTEAIAAQEKVLRSADPVTFAAGVAGAARRPFSDDDRTLTPAEAFALAEALQVSAAFDEQEEAVRVAEAVDLEAAIQESQAEKRQPGFFQRYICCCFGQ